MENEEPDPRVGLKAAGAADGTQMRVGNLVCPMAFVNVFTPMEFEEIVHLFNKYDDDRSGELDINELRKLMLESDMEYDDENVRLMLEELDEDKSGLIDFEEFCAFLARVKAGDSKLQGFVGMTEMLNTTSVGILQEQCVKRNLMVSYVIIEEHNPTAISPHKHYVMEVRLEGEWVEPSSDKGVVRSVDVRRFQGIGKSTREGRMAAAEAALRKLRSLMPGIEVEHGQLPDDWKRWLKDNAKQGVDLSRLLAELRAKGFAPFANPEVMHWALATGSLDRLIETHPAGSPTVDDARDLRPEWRAWVDRCLSIGLDGAVIVEVIQERGVSTLRMEAYAQRLRRGDGAKGANPVYPRLLDFWQCCESGLLFEVELYLSAGQPPDAPALHPPRGAISLPLSLAAARGHCEVVDALASRNVDVEATDLMGRTALHHAAKHGQVEACRYNSAQCCELLAFHGEETVRQVVSDRIPVANKPVTKIMTDAFHHLIKQRLRSNETHRFRKEWIHDAVIWCRNQLHPSKQSLLQEPSRELVDYVVGRFDPDPDAGFWQLNAGSFPTFVPSVAEPWHLAEIFRHIFRLAVCGSRDDRGWSALYQACMENRVCSHEETIRVLVEFHQSDLFQTDRNGKMAVELLFDFEGGRPNTPSGSREKEGLLMDKRKDILAEDRRQQDLEDGERKERGRVETLLKTRSKAVDMDPELWRATQEASLHLRTLGGWMEYVDPETLNRFFYRNELVLKQEPEGGKGVEEESIDHFQWDTPEEFAREEAVLLGWASVINGSEFIRTHSGRYNSVLNKRTGVVFYVDSSNEACLLTVPQQFFRCGGSCPQVTLPVDRPVGAIPPVDLTAGNYALCTMDGDMQMFRVCVACARNCHKGRLGHRTRFCKLSNTRCMCCERGEGSCLYFNKKICRKNCDIKPISGWTAYHDPELPKRLPLGAEVRPRCARDARVEVTRSSGREGARRARDALITKGLFFWKAGHVEHALSDDWYVVRIHGRAAEEEDTTDESSKPLPLDWEFQKDRLCMTGTAVFYYHAERRECTWDPPLEIRQGNPQWAKTHVHESPEEPAASPSPEKPGRSVTVAADDEKPKDREKAGDGESKDREKTKDREKAGDGESKDKENIKGREKAGGGESKDREKIAEDKTKDVGEEANGNVPGMKGGSDGAAGRELAVIPDTAGVASSSMRSFPGAGGVFDDFLGGLSSKHPKIFECGYPPLCLDEWEGLQKAARVVCIRGRYTTYLDRETSSLFYHDELKDKDDDRWEEYQDRTTGLYFYCCPALMKSSFHPPDLPPPSAEDCNSKSRLKEGDVVAFKFRGDSSPSTAEVVRVRETRTKTDAGDTLVTIHYDVKEHETAAATPGPGSNAPQRIPNAGALTLGGGKGLEKNQTGGLRTERWVKRQQLTRAPKTAEEIALDDKEAAWKHELTLAKARRKKDLSKKAEENYRAERLRKRGPSGVMIGRRERGRTEVQAAERSKKRAATEKALRDDDARVALIEAQKASQELLAAKARLATKDSKKNRRRPDKRQPPASPAPEALTSSHHQAQDHAKIASADTTGDSVIIPALANADKGVKDGWVVSAGGGLGGDIDGMEEPHRRGGDEDRLAIRARALRESLKKREDKMTTPRTVNRRRLIRMVHMAMVRQADGFVVCEWGCRAWVRRGQEKFFHETEQCSKRILPCELGCGLRMREEEWLSPSLADASVPCQQHHEEIECPRRLVPCSQRCGEWLPFEDLAQHVKVYCVKRPFPPVKCRLGCGEEFHGGLHRMLQARKSRI
eukprot:jgi/Undpi1/12456/HiC_scaffold_5.g02127.m1